MPLYENTATAREENKLLRRRPEIMVRRAGFEPAPPAWKAGILPTRLPAHEFSAILYNAIPFTICKFLRFSQGTI